VDLGFENQALRIYQEEMSLPGAHLLASVITSLFSAYTGCLCALGVHYPRAGSGGFPQESSQGACVTLRLTALRRCPRYAIC
jgi:hypothetical protein